MSDLYAHNIIFLEHLKVERERRLEEAELEREKMELTEKIATEWNEENEENHFREENEDSEKDKNKDKEITGAIVKEEKYSPLRSALERFGRSRSLTSSLAIVDTAVVTQINVSSDDDISPKTRSHENLSNLNSNNSEENLLVTRNSDTNTSNTTNTTTNRILPSFFNTVRRNASSNNIINQGSNTSSSETLDKL